MGRYDKYKDLKKRETAMCKILEEMEPDTIHEVRKMFREWMRDALREANKYIEDPIAKPITKAWRRIVPEPERIDISGYDYRILVSEDPDDWTDEEIEEYIMDEVGYPPICEPWDCTGKRFTRWCSWSRQPIGIVMIHAWGTDL